jgi:membrane dipeptidase
MILNNFSSHNDLPHMIRKNFKNQFKKFDFNDMKKSIEQDTISHTDLVRIREGKLSAQFWVSYAKCDTNGKDAARIHLEQVDVIKRLVSAYPKDMKFVTSTHELKEAFKEKKIASMIGISKTNI